MCRDECPILDMGLSLARTRGPFAMKIASLVEDHVATLRATACEMGLRKYLRSSSGASGCRTSGSVAALSPSSVSGASLSSTSDSDSRQLSRTAQVSMLCTSPAPPHRDPPDTASPARLSRQQITTTDLRKQINNSITRTRTRPHFGKPEALCRWHQGLREASGLRIGTPKS
jgi:hypothetical protein